MTYTPTREARWDHCVETIEHIEEHNCSLGCRRGAKNRTEREEFGPGGSCDVLARVAIATGPVDELDDDGEKLMCSAREPLPERAPRKRRPRPAPPGQLSIGGV